MDWINSVSNMDNTIYDICIKDSCLIIYIKTWDQKIRQIIFSNYYAFKEKNSMGREIGDILIQTNSILLEELKEDIVNGDGTIDEIAEVKSTIFYDSWNEIILLDYFYVVFTYELDIIGFSIEVGNGRLISVMNTHNCYSNTDMEAYIQRIVEELELRIPDKYLQTRGWL